MEGGAEGLSSSALLQSPRPAALQEGVEPSLLEGREPVRILGEDGQGKEHWAAGGRQDAMGTKRGSGSC